MKGLVIGVPVLGAAITAAVIATASGGEAPVHVVADAAAGRIKPPVLRVQSAGPGNGPAVTTVRRLPFFSAGLLQSVAEGQAAQSAAAAPGPGSAVPGLSPDTMGCSGRTSNGNVRFTQECGFRRQAEEDIAANPANPRNLLGGQNNSEVGFNQCGIGYSLDDGQHWGNLLPPFREWLNDPPAMLKGPGDPNRNTLRGDPGTFHTYDFASDPSPAWDSSGNGYFSCVTVDVADNASGVFVVRSPTGANGSYFFTMDPTGTPQRPYKVEEDNTPQVSNDKEFITADTYATSPNRDNVYITWTIFLFSKSGQFLASPIFGSMSTDHARTWSTPREISGQAPVCSFGDFFDPRRSPHSCDFDQGSDPVVLPNGDLAVVFNNGNTPAGDPNGQQLAIRCSPTGSSSNGTANLNCAKPRKVGDDVIQGEPQCDFGRGPEECIPGQFVRTDDYPRLAVRPSNGDLYATWQDYRNGEYDIQLARSTDGGTSWSPSATVNGSRGFDNSQAAVAVSPQTAGPDRVGVSYYRTNRVPRENARSKPFAPGMPGVQDEPSVYLLAGGSDLATPFTEQVVSPTFPPPDGFQTGFIGDYSGLTINRGLEAHPFWADTRNVDPLAPANGVTHDEDVFTDTVTLP